MILSTKSPRARLLHILQHIDGITTAAGDRASDEFTRDYVFQRALERAVEIISEAAKSLSQEMRDREPDVPWKNIIGIGNLLRHEYYRIDAESMQSILHEHLPHLRPAVVRLIELLDKN